MDGRGGELGVVGLIAVSTVGA